jgi:hypothetical protein
MEKLKVWLDDIRPPPDDSWTWCKTGIRAIVQATFIGIVEISFDHDLGEENTDELFHITIGGRDIWTETGYNVAKVFEFLVWNKSMTRFKWSIHSANPVGRKNIESAMNSCEKMWADQENLK